VSDLSAPAVADRLAVVRQRIADAGGDPDTVKVVAITKGFGAEAVHAAIGAGLEHLGENYAQDLVAKAATVREASPCWHFVGRLQRNKVRSLASLVRLWESIDRVSLAEEIARRAPGAAVLVQVNISAEATKGGSEPDATPGLVAAARDLGLDVRGLMGVAAPDPAEAPRQFAGLAALADDLGLPERSMGMTHDLEAAVREGATIVRVGTALFGPRPPS
jgi:pyridoxal phosphate enzyme (YggS family)